MRIKPKEKNTTAIIFFDGVPTAVLQLLRRRFRPRQAFAELTQLDYFLKPNGHANNPKVCIRYDSNWNLIFNSVLYFGDALAMSSSGEDGGLGSITGQFMIDQRGYDAPFFTITGQQTRNRLIEFLREKAPEGDIHPKQIDPNRE